MELVYLIIGILLLSLVVIDMLWTILWVEGGAGPITRYTTEGTWRILRKASGGNSSILSIAGPVILAFTLVMWVAFIWAGWFFVFFSGEPSIMDTESRGPIYWTDILYFTGYTVFTLGLGDFVPTNGLWRFVTTLATATGMLFITMSASYLISVLSAVNQKRSFADSVTGLGKNGEEVVRLAWNGTDFKNMDLLLMTFASQLSTITAQHNAYPILHHYHSSKDKKSLVVSLAILDEALTIFRFGIPEENRPNRALIKNARSSIESYLEALDVTFIKPADQSPPVPDLPALHEAGLPTTSQQSFELTVAELEDRRKYLAGLVKEDMRKWPSQKK